MNVFEAVAQSVTTRQTGCDIIWNPCRSERWLAVPFHHDKTPKYEAGSALPLLRLHGADEDVIDFTAALWLGKEKPPYNWHRTLGFPMRTGNRRKGKSQSPGRNPRRNISFQEARAAKPSVFLPNYLHLLRAWRRNMPCSPGGILSSPVCGSLTEARPSGISAGCAAL